MTMKNFYFILLPFLAFSCNTTKSGPEVPASDNMMEVSISTKKAKNIIFLIGDGMGLSQITAAMYANKNRINLERFPVVGLHKTHASNDLVTDSAAAATAFACGVKTYNGAIGVNPDTLPVKSILEMAEEKGLATGLVATSTIVHATPASFFAHEKRRNLYECIAMDLLDIELDYFVGGGKKYFDRRDMDNRDLIQELRAKGYQISDYFTEPFSQVMMPSKKNFGYFTSDSDPLPVSKGRGYLYAATKAGIRFLKKRSDKGFFMMTEGSQIDWGGHANESDYIISELLDFDRVVGYALDFAKKDGETLVVVTADHETGGYSIVQGSRMDSLATKFTTSYHTASMIPVFAYGPGSEEFAGIYENTEIFRKMKKVLGL
ncbi:MAG: alkaline phosphatase [Patescibacteria group bacterium]|jgi:alkaline phosphatase